MYPAGTRPKVSIVIACRNEEEHIESCIRTILAQDLPAGGFEIIVAEGMSDDGTREILARLAAEDCRIKVIDNPGRIVSTGLNAAIAVAQGDIIVRMDAHTEYARDYVRQCVAVLEETGADNVGGPWVPRGNGLIGQAISAAFQSSFGNGRAKGRDPLYAGPVDTVYLGCWRREAFDRFGLFDEELVRNQDDEFNLRILRKGGTIWQSPKIKSWYSPRQKLSQLFRQYSQYGYWKVRVLEKHRIPASARHLVPGLFILSVLSLPLASVWWSAAIWLWIAVVLAYVLSNIAASLFVACRQGWRLFPLLPVVFACHHVAYGWGFVRGVLDFLILRQHSSKKYVRLTRSQPT